ncbi:MAG TPA: hypothetical protein VNB64_10140 [Solirubrobacteraceae bacterium]|nr:hypothetical protein [Solirubrobacteraceae bacterium]
MRRFAIGLLLLAAPALTAGCGGEAASGGEGNRPIIRSSDSSWIPGQISMAELAAFQSISGPAWALGQERAQRRKRELALLEAQRIAARKKAQEDAKRKYQEALRRAREKYRLALKKAAEERRRALEKLARERARIERLRREAERRRRVVPGEECQDPVQRRTYRCSVGRLPSSGPAPRR